MSGFQWFSMTVYSFHTGFQPVFYSFHDIHMYHVLFLGCASSRSKPAFIIIDTSPRPKTPNRANGMPGELGYDEGVFGGDRMVDVGLQTAEATQ